MADVLTTTGPAAASRTGIGHFGTAPTPPPSGTMAALGISPEEAQRRRQQTGVDPGGTGYVSGQTAPNASNGAMAALGAPGAGGAAAPAPAGAGGGPAAGRWQPRAPVPVGGPFGAGPVTPGHDVSNWRTAAVPASNGAPAPDPGAGAGTTTAMSALTAPSPGPGSAPPPGPPAGAPPAATSGAPPAAPPTGTVQVPNAVTNAVSKLPVVGGAVSSFLTPSEASTAAGEAAQRAGYQTADQLSNERYDYRPGEAPAQDRVQLDTTNADQIRAQQLQALQGLTAAANGTVPSAAEIQMREQAGRNNAAALGAARALGGRSAGGAARAATLASSETNARTNVDAAADRAAEQANARNAQIAALGGVRGQDVDTAGANANLAQAANANNLGAQTTANQQSEAWRAALLNAQLQALGIGTKGGEATMNAAAGNAAAENKYKGGILGAGADALAAL